jgi:hypothetical protein
LSFSVILSSHFEENHVCLQFHFAGCGVTEVDLVDSRSYKEFPLLGIKLFHRLVNLYPFNYFEFMSIVLVAKMYLVFELLSFYRICLENLTLFCVFLMLY